MLCPCLPISWRRVPPPPPRPGPGGGGGRGGWKGAAAPGIGVAVQRLCNSAACSRFEPGPMLAGWAVLGRSDLTLLPLWSLLLPRRWRAWTTPSEAPAATAAPAWPAEHRPRARALLRVPGTPPALRRGQLSAAAARARCCGVPGAPPPLAGPDMPLRSHSCIVCSHAHPHPPCCPFLLPLTGPPCIANQPLLHPAPTNRVFFVALV